MILGPKRLAGVPDLPLAPETSSPGQSYRQIHYEEHGAVGYLHFTFPNGATITEQYLRLRDALLEARPRPTRVLVLLGGPDYWSNGIYRKAIEAAEDPADESWRNINAINGLVYHILITENKLVVSALGANAEAGGVALATAADRVWPGPTWCSTPTTKVWVASTATSTGPTYCRAASGSARP